MVSHFLCTAPSLLFAGIVLIPNAWNYMTSRLLLNNRLASTSNLVVISIYMKHEDACSSTISNTIERGRAL